MTLMGSSSVAISTSVDDSQSGDIVVGSDAGSVASGSISMASGDSASGSAGDSGLRSVMVAQSTLLAVLALLVLVAMSSFPSATARLHLVRSILMAAPVWSQMPQVVWQWSQRR